MDVIFLVAMKATNESKNKLQNCNKMQKYIKHCIFFFFFLKNQLYIILLSRVLAAAYFF